MAKRDGQIAFFANTRTGGYVLKTMAFPGHRVRTVKLSFRLPNACCASPALTWAPTGRRLAIQTPGDHNAIWTINPDGSVARRITPANGNFFNEVDWSPRGDFLTYTEGDFDHRRDPHAGIYKA
ncbi:MAG: TolB family protein, partial [Nocardioidaceae bacterium]